MQRLLFLKSFNVGFLLLTEYFYTEVLLPLLPPWAHLKQGHCPVFKVETGFKLLCLGG